MLSARGNWAEWRGGLEFRVESLEWRCLEGGSLVLKRSGLEAAGGLGGVSWSPLSLRGGVGTRGV